MSESTIKAIIPPGWFVAYVSPVLTVVGDKVTIEPWVPKSKPAA